MAPLDTAVPPCCGAMVPGVAGQHWPLTSLWQPCDPQACPFTRLLGVHGDQRDRGRDSPLQTLGRGLTRDSDVRQDGFLAVLHAADLREVDVQGQVEQAGDEGEHAHGHTVAAGVGVAVVDAELLTLQGGVEVALVHDGAKHHNGEYL